MAKLVGKQVARRREERGRGGVVCAGNGWGGEGRGGKGRLGAWQDWGNSQRYRGGLKYTLKFARPAVMSVELSLQVRHEVGSFRVWRAISFPLFHSQRRSTCLPPLQMMQARYFPTLQSLASGLDQVQVPLWSQMQPHSPTHNFQMR